MMKSTSPGASLFASDYSLSPNPSPPLARNPSPNPSLSSSLRNPRSSPNPPEEILLQPIASRPANYTTPLPVVFPTPRQSNGSPPLHANQLPTPPTSPAYDKYTPAPVPRSISGKFTRKTSMVEEMQEEEEEVAQVPVLLNKLPVRPVSSASSKQSTGYRNCEQCMEGESFLPRLRSGLGHETKSASYKPGTEKAYHHLQRANDLFGQALAAQPGFPKGMLAKAKVLIQLAMNYQPPKVATLSLREAVHLLRDLVRIAPKSVSARETLAQACALLSGLLHDTDDTATVDDETRVWEGPVGCLAREALAQLEDVAADKMDKMRTMHQRDAAELAPSMAEMFLALSSAAITVSTLATDLPTVDLHIELAEQALDQASNMSTVAAAARVKSSTSSANLITRVQLASGRSSLERLRHTFLLGTDLDEDDFRSLMADMAMLATECRERAAKLKGSKAAAASTLAWDAIKQLGDAKVLYASLLRLVWRKRKPSARKRASEGMRKLSQRTASMESDIKEEDEEEDSKSRMFPSTAHILLSASKASSLSAPSDTERRESGSSYMRKGSQLDRVREGREISTFTPPPPGPRGSISVGPDSLARRGSWMPQGYTGIGLNGNTHSGVHGMVGRSRRASSMSAPLVGPDGISAWTRKASVISFTAEEEGAGLVPSAQLASSAWELLDGAIKQYKLALTLLSSSDLPPAHLARGKADTLTQIAYASWFQASLATRVALAADKRTGLLVTAEVYATWAAREVGWSFLIEGTQEAAQADRRTNSWRADESGKRAVMMLVRTWWHRAVTTEMMDTDTKTAAKDAVEVVVRRMRDREGVRDGDVARWRAWLGKNEGEMDAAEGLFWRSVSRILRGGAGFVMS